MDTALATIPRPVAFGLGVVLLIAWAFATFSLHWGLATIGLIAVGVVFLARALWPAPVRHDHRDPSGE